MTGFKESSTNDSPASDYYRQATVASDRGDFELAKEICLSAIKQFEQVGDERKVSEGYHKLGLIAYREGEIKDAESWYQKSLAIAERICDDRGAARTCNNLGAVANARGEYDTAEEWLWKSIRIKEQLADEDGLAASYHQLGYVAETRLDFDSAEKWYLKSLDFEEMLNSEIGVAKTCFNLCRIFEKRGNTNSAEDWRQRALQALGRKGHASSAIKLGMEAKQQCKYEDSRILFLRALDIAKQQGDDDGQSQSYLWLGHLACTIGDYESAKDHYERSIEIDERLHATDRAARSCLSLGNICLAKINGGRRDFRSASRWFRKSLELRQNASWRDLLAMHAHLWHYRLLSVFSK